MSTLASSPTVSARVVVVVSRAKGETGLEDFGVILGVRVSKS